ncbi:MAG: hypothetical protein HY033_07670 [Ignavibacteriae bacterium]|nr:hypothetical protein [Ignavibacteriota bacterium]
MNALLLPLLILLLIVALLSVNRPGVDSSQIKGNPSTHSVKPHTVNPRDLPPAPPVPSGWEVKAIHPPLPENPTDTLKKPNTDQSHPRKKTKLQKKHKPSGLK